MVLEVQGVQRRWGFGHGPDCAFRANRTFVGRLQLGAKSPISLTRWLTSSHFCTEAQPAEQPLKPSCAARGVLRASAIILQQKH